MPWPAGIPALEHLALAEQIETLNITTDAIEHTKQLTLDHRDPFDRIIAASAVTSGMRLISSDPQMDLFVKDRVW
jgi:PIN domain nuclease of toxin-antitoxin system